MMQCPVGYNGDACGNQDVRTGLLWELLHADDLAIIYTTRQLLVQIPKTNWGHGRMT